MKPRIAEHDLNDALGGRVFPEDRIDLFPDRAEHISLSLESKIH
jgi:hypothetical protein